MSSELQHQESLLGTSMRRGRAFASCLSDFWYVIMFIFAPIPLGSFAAAVDVRSVARRCIPKLPSYLSQRSKASLYFILVFTQFSFYAWITTLVATLLVLCSDPFGKLGWWKWLSSSSSTSHNENARLEWNHSAGEASAGGMATLAWWLVVGHVILFGRALMRKYVGKDMQTRGFTPEIAATTELSIDVAVWTSMLGLYAIRIYVVLRSGKAFVELKATGILSDKTIDFVHAAVQAMFDAWIVDIILRIAWMFIQRHLEADFKACVAYRQLSRIPDAENVEECSICLVDTASDGCQLPCRHIFHRSCLTSWARTRTDGAGLNCPMCRAVPNFDGY